MSVWVPWKRTPRESQVQEKGAQGLCEGGGGGGLRGRWGAFRWPCREAWREAWGRSQALGVAHPPELGGLGQAPELSRAGSLPSTPSHTLSGRRFPGIATERG